MIFRVILLGFLLSPLVSGSQEDTVLLDPIWIKAPVLRQTDPGARVREIHKSPILSTLGLLLNQANIFSRHAGPGSISTVSIRGGSSSQTALLWNGIPIQNPMLGLIDFNLIPLLIVDEVEIKPGGSTALWGSGAVAGSILLSNQAPEKRQFVLQAESGSFGYYAGMASLEEKKGPWKSSTRIFFNESANHFPYDRGNGVREISKHAAYGQVGVMQSLYVSLSKKLETSVHLWLQKSEVEIPPLLTQKQSLAIQGDQSVRAIVALKYVGKISTATFKLAMANEKNHFEDSLIFINNTNLFQNWMADYFRDYQIKSFWKSGIGGTILHSNATADAYDSKRDDTRSSIFINQLFYGNRWNILLAARQEWSRDFQIPISPILSANWIITPLLSIKSKISRDYRLPTLNDRFWQPGGNPDLKPESGWSRELGLRYDRELKASHVELEGSVFYRRIEDWILWGRQEGQLFFSPANIALVRSRGMEITSNYKYSPNGKKLTYSCAVNYTLIRSTHERSQKNPTIDQGDQLIYTPEHQGSFLIQLNLNEKKISYQQYFTGPFQGINQRLPGYSTAEMQFSYPVKIYDRNFLLYSNLSNLWNLNYQVIEQRPMPGRNFRLGIRFIGSKNQLTI